MAHMQLPNVAPLEGLLGDKLASFKSPSNFWLSSTLASVTSYLLLDDHQESFG
jgi:hypothetical protein